MPNSIFSPWRRWIVRLRRSSRSVNQAKAPLLNIMQFWSTSTTDAPLWRAAATITSFVVSSATSKLQAKNVPRAPKQKLCGDERVFRGAVGA